MFVFLNNLKKNILVVFLFLLLIPFIALSQGSTIPITLPKVLPASPQAQTYMRYGEIPIDLSTGVPNISIPIYTLKANKLEIPINISYHASGNKVSDIASTVGLGWVLNAGGVIVQNIVNNEDSYPLDFAFSSAQDVDNLLASQANTTDVRWLQYAGNKNYVSTGDIASDKYYINFNGFSGFFRYNMVSKEIETMPYSTLKIKRINFNSFEITDDEGIIWKFDHKGVQQGPNGFIGGSKEYYLTKIGFPGSNETVELNYINSDEYYTYGFSETARHGVQVKHEGWIKLDPNFDEYVQSTSTNYINSRETDLLYQTKVNSPLLSSITWKNRVLSFNYLKDRLDPMKERLSTIEIKDGDVSKITSFDNNHYLGVNSGNYRLMLNGIKVDQEEYKFSYNPIDLPYYSNYNYQTDKAFCEDFWGYYNGNHKHHIPFKWTEGTIVNNLITKAVRSYVPSREPDTSLVKAGILTAIRYPTGGRSEFEFELNRGKNVYSGFPEKTDSINYFGGLRIKKVINFEGDKISESKFYEYSGGATTRMITPAHFLKNTAVFYVPKTAQPAGMYNYQDINVYDNEFASHAMSGFPFDDNGSVGFYKNVTVYNDALDKKSGKTDYEYSSYIPADIINLDRGSIKPDLLKQREYEYKNGAYGLLKETTNGYTKVALPKFLTAIRVEEEDKTTDPYPILLEDIPFKYYLQPLKVLGYQFNKNFSVWGVLGDKSFNLLTETSVKDFTPGGVIESKTSYLYDPSYRLLTPIEVRKTGSDNIVRREVFTHPFDYPGNTDYQQMVIQNIRSPTVEVFSYKESVLLSKTKQDFKKFGNQFFVGNVSAAKGNDVYEKRINYLKYDENGNPLFITKDSVTKIVYLWSYKGEFPVAEITNVSYTDMEGVLGTANIASFRNSNPDKGALDNFLQPLKLAFPQARISQYTYKSLLGITTSTDIKGLTTYYQYDNFHKLKSVKDHNGNIIRNYQYNYKPVPVSTVYYNARKEARIIRNNCGVGKVGGEVVYVVPAGTYTSTLSQASADYRADRDIELNGQNYANNAGSCNIDNSNPTNLNFNIENSLPQGITVILNVNGTPVSDAKFIASGGSVTVTTPISQGSLFNVSLMITSANLPHAALLSDGNIDIDGLVSSNNIIFNNVNLSVPNTFTITLF